MKELKIKIDADIQIPTVPNFILVKIRKSLTGFDQSVPISDFTDEELREIGQLWIDKLIEHAQAVRKMNNP